MLDELISLPASDVIVCGAVSWFVQIIVSPVLIVSVDGLNAYPLISMLYVCGICVSVCFGCSGAFVSCCVCTCCVVVCSCAGCVACCDPAATASCCTGVCGCCVVCWLHPISIVAIINMIIIPRIFVFIKTPRFFIVLCLVFIKFVGY